MTSPFGWVPSLAVTQICNTMFGLFHITGVSSKCFTRRKNERICLIVLEITILGICWRNDEVVENWETVSPHKIWDELVSVVPGYGRQLPAWKNFRAEEIAAWTK